MKYSVVCTCNDFMWSVCAGERLWDVLDYVCIRMYCVEIASISPSRQSGLYPIEYV